MDFAGLNTLWHQLRNVGLSVETPHVPGLVQHQTGALDHDRSAPAARLLLRRCRLLRPLRLLIVGTKESLQIRRKLSFPGDPEYYSRRRHEFPHHGSGGRGDFVHHIGALVHTAQSSLHAGLVGQHRHGGEWQRQKQSWKQNSGGFFAMVANQPEDVHALSPSPILNRAPRHSPIGSSPAADIAGQQSLRRDLPDNKLLVLCRPLTPCRKDYPRHGMSRYCVNFLRTAKEKTADRELSVSHLLVAWR